MTADRDDSEHVRVISPTTASLDELVAMKTGRTISVCLPARNEQETVGPIVASIVEELTGPSGSGLVDQVIVFDDDSSDDTAIVSKEAGADVVSVADVLLSEPPGSGKGNVMWRSLAACTGDIIVWCDTDLRSFTTDYVTRLVAPLLDDPELALVKAYYERPVDISGNGGGRTTELVARPMLSMFFPPLATVRQPLGGEVAATRALLEQLPFVESYGVESAMLIDTYRHVGLSRMAQVDLGIRTHRHRSLVSLSEQSSEIIAVILSRAGLDLPAPMPPLINQYGIERPVFIAERPPMVEIAGYRDLRS
jgi:glucosyl-3-phosphoglycerate synthase